MLIQFLDVVMIIWKDMIILQNKKINIIDNLVSLKQFLHTQSEIVVFPIGIEGHVFTDFLYYTNSTNNVCCLTAEKWNGERKFIHSIPLFPSNCLTHFRDTAAFIVAAPQKLHSNICQELTKFGCDNIVLIKEEVIQQLQNELNRISTSGQMLNWFINNFAKKINELENKIAEQNEICAVNTKAFEIYRNCFREKKLVIVATGPSAKYYKPIPDAIHIGLNFAWKLENIPLNYLFMSDYSPHFEHDFSKVQNKIFIGKFLDSIRSSFLNHPEQFSFMRKDIIRFYINDDAINQVIYQNICYHPLMEFFSIVFPTLHFSLFTYPKEIYLVGCDTSNTGHAYKEKQTNFDNYFHLFNMKVGYARVKLFAQQYYPETQIISVNPVGLKGLFNDIYTENFEE